MSLLRDVVTGSFWLVQKRRLLTELSIVRDVRAEGSTDTDLRSRATFALSTVSLFPFFSISSSFLEKATASHSRAAHPVSHGVVDPYRFPEATFDHSLSSAASKPPLGCLPHQSLEMIRPVCMLVEGCAVCSDMSKASQASSSFTSIARPRFLPDPSLPITTP